MKKIQDEVFFKDELFLSKAPKRAYKDIRRETG